jgi:alcohol dehydrogenase (cytochrome c)
MKIKRLVFVLSACALLIGAIGSAILYSGLAHQDSVANPESGSGENIWEAVSCRAGLYLQRAEGKASELSWGELWAITRPGRGFYCAGGGSLEGRIQFSQHATGDDRREGARIFRERCTGCHGEDGAGGPVGPSLIRSEYHHGDTDLAIYRVLRDGVSGTAMPRAGLSPLELLQVTAHIKELQARASKDEESETTRLGIQVGSERLQVAGTKTDEWLTYSGSYNGWRHAPISEITPATVAQLRIRWIKQFDIQDSNIEATPLVVDGTIFIAPDPEHVLALDAKTGDVFWEYKRPIPAGSDLPIDYGPVNRGLAIHGNTVFFGGLDGHLVALNANNGKVVWQTLVASPSDGYSITAAPLVVKDSVIVGISGGEYKTRGFLAAYSVLTGQLQWRFDTIPGPGELGHETWGNDAWRTGGGGTWVTGSYDPSSDLLYWGVGNPSPAFSGDVRPGDNLFTDSVIALHAGSGNLAWYFQFTPHDEHDRDAAQTPVLADLLINGVVRKVICWPNRNGFYYVLDRITGEFLSGAPFVELDWAKGLTSTGRPVLSDTADMSTAGRRSRPGIGGGTNWQNPTFDPVRGTVFVPALESSSVFTKDSPNEFVTTQNGYFVGSGWSQPARGSHRVVALDGATGRRKWEYAAPPGGDLDYSGLLSTGGGLVFGASGGVCFALDSDTGREVWRLTLGGNTKSAPISFTIDGRQVIAVAAGRSLFMLGL